MPNSPAALLGLLTEKLETLVHLVPDPDNPGEPAVVLLPASAEDYVRENAAAIKELIDSNPHFQRIALAYSGDLRAAMRLVERAKDALYAADSDIRKTKEERTAALREVKAVGQKLAAQRDKANRFERDHGTLATKVQSLQAQLAGKELGAGNVGGTGELLAQLEQLRAELTTVGHQRDAWRARCEDIQAAVSFAEPGRLRQDDQDAQDEQGGAWGASDDELELESLQQAADKADYPSSLRDLPAWAAQNCEDKVLFAPGLLDEASNAEFDRPELVYKGLEWLANSYRGMRLGEVSFSECRDALRATGLEDSWTLTSVASARMKESHTFVVDGQSFLMDRHLKRGRSFDKRRTLRMYYSYCPQRERVIVGAFPSHLEIDRPRS